MFISISTSISTGGRYVYLPAVVVIKYDKYAHVFGSLFGGILDWNTGMEYWTTGMEYWNDLLHSS